METAAEAVARMEAGKGKGKSEWRLRDCECVVCSGWMDRRIVLVACV